MFDCRSIRSLWHERQTAVSAPWQKCIALLHHLRAATNGRWSVQNFRFVRILAASRVCIFMHVTRMLFSRSTNNFIKPADSDPDRFQPQAAINAPGFCNLYNPQIKENATWAEAEMELSIFGCHCYWVENKTVLWPEGGKFPFCFAAFEKGAKY